MEGLKRLCEYTIAQVSFSPSFFFPLSKSFPSDGFLFFFSSFLQDITVENVSPMYELSIAFNATSLRQACIVFILEQFDQLSTRSWCVMNLQFSPLKETVYCFMTYIP